MATMSNAMQSYRDRDRSYPPAPASRSHGDYSANRNSGSISHDQYRNRSNDNDRRRHDYANQSHSLPSLSTSASSRWEPPKRRSYPPAVAVAGGGGQPAVLHRERENNPRGSEGGRHGGGKVNRQRRHSNDTHDQRNQHRQRQQQQARPKKTIITPDEEPGSAASQTKPPKENEDIPKLNPSDVTHARRIRQRRRQVLYGKNTAGYEEYIKKVPRHRRRPRSLECPATPDHTLDIPAKRWQGLLNAWRRSLHKYDPPDLHLRQPSQDKITLAPRPCVTEEDKAQEEIAQAKASGLQVAFGSMNVGREAGMFSVGVAEEENALANGAAAEAAAAGKTEDVPFEEEAAYQQTPRGFLEGSDSDSDDDVL